MILKIQDIIKYVFQDIGAIAKSESPAPDEIQAAVNKLNMFIDACSARSLMILAAIMENFTLVSGQHSYTIGVGGNFNTSKPSKITDAFIRLSEGEDIGLDILTLEEWNGIETKSLDTAQPVALYYDPGLTQQATQTGTVWLYPTPDSADTYTLFIGEQKPLTELVNPTDAITFQSAYYEFLEYSLAKRLWRQYHDDGGPFPADLEALRREAEQVVMTMNAKQVTCDMEIPGRRGNFDNILDFGWNWSR